MTPMETLANMFVSMSKAEMDRALSCLPEIERSVLSMVIEGKSQVHIAGQLRVSQPTVSYRIGKAVSRIKFNQSIPDLSQVEIAQVMQEHSVKKEDQHAVVAFLFSKSQVEAGRKVGRSQGWVRHRILRVIDKLEGTDLATILLRFYRRGCRGQYQV
jgi:predicted transcriptional regulator